MRWIRKKTDFGQEITPFVQKQKRMLVVSILFDLIGVNFVIGEYQAKQTS